MNIEFTLNKEDFLSFHLFSSSKSETHIKKRRRNKIILPIIYALSAPLFILLDNLFLAGFFLFISVIWYLYFPVYEAKKYINHFQKMIDENYSERFEKNNSIKTDHEFIYINDPGGEMKIKLNELIRINEIANYWFFRFKSGSTLIVPKYKFNNSKEIENSVQQLIKDHSVEYVFEPDWKWK